MSLPENILQRVQLLERYHQSTKYSESARPSQPDMQLQPRPYRIFDKHSKVELPSTPTGVDVGVATLSLLGHRPDAIRDSQLNPPHDLKTLATWLFMAYGITHKVEEDGQTHSLRSCPSAGHTFPGEIYVAAFAIEGLEPGLYHYSPREFALRKLRDGDEAFLGLVQTFGDAQVVTRSTAALLVSTIFLRSAWRYGERGYRSALLDAGHLLENLVVAASGLGIETLITLHPESAPARQLIGVAADADISEAESVQAIVVWANPTEHVFAPKERQLRIEPIPRATLSAQGSNYESILRAHDACTAAGGIVHEIKPPLTEISPLSQQIQTIERPPDEQPHGGEWLMKLLQARRSARAFQRTPISREHFLWINRVALRGHAYWPMQPADGHAALVRPFWIVNDVRGLDPGIWYYDPPSDRWANLAHGETRMEAAYICMEQQLAADASAVCFVAANLHLLMNNAGPDLYRLAHLEAGSVAHRVQLAAPALKLGACGIGSFFDDEIRKFLGLDKTRWEILYATAIGVPADQEQAVTAGDQQPTESEESQWRD